VVKLLEEEKILVAEIELSISYVDSFDVSSHINLNLPNMQALNQVVWAPVVRSSFQKRTRRIPGSIFRGNNVWSVCMPLRTNWISRSPLVGRKPVRKSKKIIFKHLY